MQKQSRCIVLLLALLFALAPYAFARRAPMREIRFTQPDGSVFYGRNIGDQYLHYTIDQDGAILLQDTDGWWCYAYFDADNHFRSTGIRVGQAGSGAVQKVTQVPRALIAEARRQKASLQTNLNSCFRQNESTRALSGAQDSVAPIERAQESGNVIRGLVLLASFSDTTFVYSNTDFNNLLNQEGYSRAGAVGCAKEYFRAQFGDRVSFEFEVEGPYKLPHNQSYYGENNLDKKGDDKNPAQMVIDVCKLADADVDFSQYDADGDDYIDNVFVFYAGCNEADGGIPSSVWPHAWYVARGAGITVKLDGKTLDRYACTSEKEYRTDYKTYMASIGTFCHEFSHTLGLVDLYDTDYDDDSKFCGAGCRGITALMDAGNGNNNGNTPPNYNAIDRYILPKYFPGPVQLEEGEYCLAPISEGGVYYSAKTDVQGEFFLFECRDNTSGWDRHIGGNGLLVYHVDMSHNLTGPSQHYKDGEQMLAIERWYCNEVNANVDAQCGYIVPADESLSLKIPYYDYITRSYCGSTRQAFFPQGNNTFTALNGFTFRSGQDSEYSLVNIRKDGTSVRFTVTKSALPPYVKDEQLNSIALQDCQIFSWKLPQATDAQCIVRFGFNVGGVWDAEEQELAPYAPGCYAVAFDKLMPLTTYKIEIYYQENGLTGKRCSRSLVTMKRNVGNGTPFISFKNVERNADGSFLAGAALPLRLINALNAQSVEWYFNGKAVSVDGSCFYKPGRSGVLKAVLRDKDGVESNICKEIIVR